MDCSRIVDNLKQSTYLRSQNRKLSLPTAHAPQSAIYTSSTCWRRICRCFRAVSNFRICFNVFMDLLLILERTE